MEIIELKAPDSITLEISGRLDTITSPELQTAILTAFKKTELLILNLQEVDYISSAGLRALLIGQKTAMSKGGHMYLKNIQETVAEVLKLSGFTNILEIL